jgi:thiol-disulfide isomerase/thioredoxin
MVRRSDENRRQSAAIGICLLLCLLLVQPLSAAKELRLVGLEGGELRESELEEGSFVLVVWASWSPRGRDIVQRINRLSDRWGSEEIGVLSVNFQEEKPEIEDFLRGKGMRVPVYLDSDGAFSKKHRVATLPGLLVIKDGEVTFRGRLPANPDQSISRALE